MSKLRRLSNGSKTGSLLGEILEEDEMDSEYFGGGSSKVRKSIGAAGGGVGGGRKSIGGIGRSAAENDRIAAMYKQVIQMSSENVSGDNFDYIYCFSPSSLVLV